MNKEDFLREMQKLDPKTRREVVEKAGAPREVAEMVEKKATLAPVKPPQQQQKAERSESAPAPRFLEPTVPRPAPAPAAVPAGVKIDEGDQETPAERRRREAALGMAANDDSDDEEGGERVPPSRRGIRFADDISPTARE